MLDDGAKRIVASWYDRPPDPGYRGKDVGREA